MSEKPAKTVVTTVLNIAPMAAPINPYNFGARYLAASKQGTDTPDVTAEIAERVKYMNWLQKKLPPLESHEPIVCLALVRAALDAKARAFLRTALASQDELLAATAAASTAVAVAKPAIVPEVSTAQVDALAAALARIEALEAARVAASPVTIDAQAVTVEPTPAPTE